MRGARSRTQERGGMPAAGVSYGACRRMRWMKAPFVSV